MTSGSSIVPSGSDESHVPASKKGVLQELERHGYVAEPLSAGPPGVMICRHPAAPNLLVRDDGRIELLSGKSETQGWLHSQPLVKRIHRGRALLFLTLLGVTTFLGLLIVAMIVG
jgi:hypothetical protein